VDVFGHAEDVNRLQFMIEEDLDEALAQAAREEGVSKSALIRRYIRERLKPLPPLREDPLWELIGTDGIGEPDDSLRVDEVVYPR
jgi:hypothetical protein